MIKYKPGTVTHVQCTMKENSAIFSVVMLFNQAGKDGFVLPV